jgi:hypothetical protein
MDKLPTWDCGGYIKIRHAVLRKVSYLKQICSNSSFALPNRKVTLNKWTVFVSRVA